MLRATATWRSAPQSRYRLAICAVTLLFVAGQLRSLYHRAFVLHAICPEHGEQIHVDNAQQDVHPASPAGVASLVSKLHKTAPVGAFANNHDHCELCVTRHSPAIEAAWVQLSAPAMSDDWHDCEPAGCTVPSRARYRIAPKTSPPA